MLLYFFEEGVGALRVEDFVAVHDGHEVFGVGEVDDVVGVAGEHVDGLDVVAVDLPFEDLALGIIEAALLDEAVALDHDELLELGVVPVLALGDAGLGDVDAHLAGRVGVDELGEGAALIDVHLEREGGLLVGQVAEVGAVELLGEAPGRDLGDHQGPGLLGKGFEELDNLTQGDVVGHGAVAVAAIGLVNHLQPLELAVVLLAFEAGHHFVHEVVDVEELQLHAGVVDGVGQVVGEGVAEGGDGAVVVGTAPFAEKVREAEDQYLGARLFAVFQEEVLPCFLAATVFAVAKAAGERGLLGA